jgi:hypothetical protein
VTPGSGPSRPSDRCLGVRSARRPGWPLATSAVGAAVAVRRARVLAGLVTTAALWCTPAAAQTGVIGGRLQQRANALLTVMGFGLTPDVTTGSIGITDTSTGDARIQTTSLGGGFTVSESVPLYLEGTAGYSRYDPKFLVTDGTETRTIPTRWNSLTVTVGVGWDVVLAQDLKLRPILNATYGRIVSDVTIGAAIADFRNPDADFEFLQNGHLNAAGLGGSLMLDYERYRPEGEIDAELRYTSIQLRSRGSTSLAVEGTSLARSLNLWTRWRAPTGWVMFERPVRYVLEYAHTTFYGDLDGALGFDHLNSVGAGLELDTSKYDSIVTRVRLVLRYKFGPNVRGAALGLAVSF